MAKKYIYILLYYGLNNSVNELRRQAYLEAMGIKVYYPRTALPGAKPSPRYELAEKSSIFGKRVEDSSNYSAIEKQKSNQHRAQTKAVIDNQETELIRNKELNPDAKLEQITPDSNILKFSLGYYSINDSLSVINEVPHLKAGSLSEESLSLLRNILTALGVNADGCNFSSENFDWPIVEGLSVATEPNQAARQALGGFITMRQQQDGFSNLLVFAGEIDELLVKKSGKEEVRDYKVEQADYYFTITNSLQMMLSYPRLKREVWDQLQPLKQRLNN